MEKQKYEYSEIIKSFITQLKDLTSIQNTFLELPTMTCFNFCIKESINICRIYKETGNRSYLELITDFFNYMKKDKILKSMDKIAYINLLRELKKIVEDNKNVNFEEIENFFINYRNIFGKKYVKKLRDLIIECINNNDCMELEKLTLIFVSEMMSRGYSYKYLNEIIETYSKRTDKAAAKDLIDFLINEKNNYDIYLPLKNVCIVDIDFIKNGFSEQMIYLGKNIELDNIRDIEKDKYYAHIYFSYNDYYSNINTQIKRLKSIFNLKKFYTNSTIDFDYDMQCIIKSNIHNTYYNKSLREILHYEYFRSTEKIINNTISTIKEIKNKNKNNDILEDVFDIIDYSEKCGNELTTDQFINKWISLETLFNKYNKTGFNSVIEYAPRILSIMFFRQKLNRLLKNAFFYLKNDNMPVDKFIKLCYDGNIDNYINRNENKYYKIQLEKYKEIISNPKKLKKELALINDYIRINIFRIYILRNKYIHLGETRTHSDIPQYMLCHILSFSIDKFIRSINDLNSYECNDVSWVLAFTNLINKYNMLYTGIEIMSENIKIDSKLNIKFEDIAVQNNNIKNTEEIISEIILEKHINILESYN